MSMHDPKNAAINNKYFPAEIFEGYNATKFSFVNNAVKQGKKSNIVILSHINLLLAAWLIKKVSPTTKVILLAHGIEVWQPLTATQKMMVGCCDKIVSVSSFTKDKIIALHHLPKEICFVLNNCIDPFLEKPKQKSRNPILMERYGFKSDDIILITLTRLSRRDRYKGYCFVLEALGEMIQANSKIKYLLAGSYEMSEKIYLDELVLKNNLQSNVVFTGFVQDKELADHFSLADIYVMPSIKEGFGIVFVEAMYYGVPVIAANADGSSDALLHGKLGLLTEPESTQAVKEALQKMISNHDAYLPNHNLLMENFGYDTYKRKLATELNFENPLASENSE